MGKEHGGPKPPTGLRINKNQGGETMKKKGGLPIWKILKTGSADPVAWENHPQNPRFAVFNPADAGSLSDDMVLDKETGLVWARDANLIGQYNWLDANTLCREFALGNRSGWRLPTVEELSSLLDLSQTDLALPQGHPFINVQYGSGVNAYWTCTNHENPDAAAWFVNFWRGAGPHLSGLGSKSIQGFVWPVRGGVAGNNWNW